jgi:hypothetical protein
MKLTQEQRREIVRYILNSKFQFGRLHALKRDYPEEWRTPGCERLRVDYREAMRLKKRLAGASDTKLLEAGRQEYSLTSESDHLMAVGAVRIEKEKAEQLKKAFSKLGNEKKHQQKEEHGEQYVAAFIQAAKDHPRRGTEALLQDVAEMYPVHNRIPAVRTVRRNLKAIGFDFESFRKERKNT